MILKDDFVTSLQACEGYNIASFIEAHASAPSISFRINESKLSIKELDKTLAIPNGTVFSSQKPFHTVPWCSNAFYLEDRPVFTLDPYLHAGAYYVQEASSMFIDHILRIALEGRNGLRALDLCAAPGGKTTLLANLPHLKLLLANEIIHSRVSTLYENVVKWGRDHVFISNNDPREIGKLSGFFDVILVDAPCSGSGLFRKDPSAMNHWNTELVDFCSVRQKRILEDIYPSLAENGILVYSTCSYSFEENEANVDNLLSSFDLECIRIPFPQEWGIVESQSPLQGGYGYRFYPDKLRGEGFFCSVFVKKETTPDVEVRAKRSKGKYKSDKLGSMLANPEEYICYLHEDNVFAIGSKLFEDFLVLGEGLTLKRSGLRLGNLIREELIPDHELAMSISKNLNLPSIEVNLELALKYLRKMDLGINVDEKGWMLVKYNGVALGWVKSIPRRLNNYYPKNWRILMS